MKITSINQNIYSRIPQKVSENTVDKSVNNKNYNPAFYMPNFCAVKDLTPQYILKKRSHLLPERVLKSLKEVCENPPKVMPSMKDIHFAVYKKLFESKSLEEAKKLFPEFEGIKDAKELENNPSCAISAIKKKMPLEDFSLSILKDLFSFHYEDELVKKYGFTNRSQLIWMLKKLNIPKLQGNYNMIIKLTDESTNARFAQLAEKTLRSDPNIEQKRIENILKTVKSDEYREKKRLLSEELLKNNPHLREDTRLVSKITWERCPEIKEALSQYTKEQSNILKKSLMNKIQGKKLSDAEQNIINSYYTKFWNSHPDLKEKYSQTRHEVIQELKSKGLIK